MNTNPATSVLRMIPVDRIVVNNPRERSSASFKKVKENVAAVGLKKPITVTPRIGADGAEYYLLICGEGRLLIARELGAARVPALFKDVSDEVALLMSLAENIARRRHQPLELLEGITELQKRGDNSKEIAHKTGLTESYVQEILLLLERGEQRLIVAVETGKIPLRVALTISRAGRDDKAVQTAMQDAYDSGALRGTQLLYAKRLVERRQHFGRGMGRSPSRPREAVTSTALVREYKNEVQRQEALVKRWSIAQKRLHFMAGALRNLLADERFLDILKEQGLDTLPKYLAERIPAGVEA